MWDVDFQTAVAQAEMEDRRAAGAYHRLPFDDIEIETTRPELRGRLRGPRRAPRRRSLADRFGTQVHTPLFGVEVPVVAHRLADPEKGTGHRMICTFGDVTDVVWWRELDLPDPARSSTRRPAAYRDAPPGVPDGDGLAGHRRPHAEPGRTGMVELLAEAATPRRAPADRPRGALLRAGRPSARDRDQPAVVHQQRRPRRRAAPGAARSRATSSTGTPPSCGSATSTGSIGLNGDWLISRQHYFGIPFPSGTRSTPTGRSRHDRPSSPDEATLPVDPTTDVPPGYSEDQRGKPGGFVGDPDVMDTWATSSLTPQIAGGWEDDPDLFAATFPMDLRPQGPEIIRTWLFTTLLRCTSNTDVCPGRTPRSTDGSSTRTARRCPSPRATWSPRSAPRASSAPTPCATGPAAAAPGPTPRSTTAQMKVGRRLAIKILNASKFVLCAGRRAAPGLDAVTSRSTSRCSPSWPRWSTPPRRRSRLRLRARARAGRGLLLVLLRRLPRAREVPGLRRGRPRRRRLGPGHPGPRPLGRCTASSPPSCPS